MLRNSLFILYFFFLLLHFSFFLSCHTYHITYAFLFYYYLTKVWLYEGRWNVKQNIIENDWWCCVLLFFLFTETNSCCSYFVRVREGTFKTKQKVLWAMVSLCAGEEVIWVRMWRVRESASCSVSYCYALGREGLRVR